MKKNRILTESQKRQIIENKEKVILESFASTFNRIKRIDESEINEVIDSKSIGSNLDKGTMANLDEAKFKMDIQSAVDSSIAKAFDRVFDALERHDYNLRLDAAARSKHDGKFSFLRGMINTLGVAEGILFTITSFGSNLFFHGENSYVKKLSDKYNIKDYEFIKDYGNMISNSLKERTKEIAPAINFDKIEDKINY